MTILLVEDDTVLADGLIHALSQSGYRVTWAATGIGAEELVQSRSFELAVLDLGLPDMDGLDWLRRLRERRILLPVLILTARDGMRDRIEGIRQGADDYMVKPFALQELEARIHALMRRCHGAFGRSTTVGRLTLEAQFRRISADGEPIELTARDYRVLEILMQQAGKVVAKERIGRLLSADDETQTDNAIDIYLYRLRKRIGGYGVAIRTVRGLGYLLEAGTDE